MKENFIQTEGNTYPERRITGLSDYRRLFLGSGLSTILRQIVKGLFIGQIMAIEIHETHPFLRGEVLFQGTGRHRHSTMRIFFQNESLIAWENNQVVATGPDLITIVDMDSFHPVSNRSLRPR